MRPWLRRKQSLSRDDFFPLKIRGSVSILLQSVILDTLRVLNLRVSLRFDREDTRIQRIRKVVLFYVFHLLSIYIFNSFGFASSLDCNSIKLSVKPCELCESHSQPINLNPTVL